MVAWEEADGRNLQDGFAIEDRGAVAIGGAADVEEAGDGALVGLLEPVSAVEAVLAGHRVGEAVLPFAEPRYGDGVRIYLVADLGRELEESQRGRG